MRPARSNLPPLRLPTRHDCDRRMLTPCPGSCLTPYLLSPAATPPPTGSRVSHALAQNLRPLSSYFIAVLIFSSPPIFSPKPRCRSALHDPFSLSSLHAILLIPLFLNNRSSSVLAHIKNARHSMLALRACHALHRDIAASRPVPPPHLSPSQRPALLPGLLRPTLRLFCLRLQPAPTVVSCCLWLCPLPSIPDRTIPPSSASSKFASLLSRLITAQDRCSLFPSLLVPPPIFLPASYAL